MALRQRIGLIILMSMSLFTMVLSILKTIGLNNIANQQKDPTATDVQYNASLEILWSLLEQAFVINMGCVPPLRAVVRLELTQSISSSLTSLLRRSKSSKSSSDNSLQYEGTNRPYVDLEMSTNRLGRARSSQQDLVEKKGILSTTKVSVSHSRGLDNV